MQTRKAMKQVDITISRAGDGAYSAYCNDHPALFGMGSTPEEAKAELEETLRLTKEDGDAAYIHPDWLDDDYEFIVHWDALHRLGNGLMHTSF